MPVVRDYSEAILSGDFDFETATNQELRLAANQLGVDIAHIEHQLATFNRSEVKQDWEVKAKLAMRLKALDIDRIQIELDSRKNLAEVFLTLAEKELTSETFKHLLQCSKVKLRNVT